MPESVDSLILDLLAWLDEKPRAYAEVMDAWRTSCPRLPVWEEAVDRGLVERVVAEDGAVVSLTDRGRRALLRRRSGAESRDRVE